MNPDKERIAKNTVMLYFRMLLRLFVALYTSRVLLNVLGVKDFGIYNVVGGVASLFSFLNSAMASGTQRFLSFELGRNEFCQYNKVFSATLILHFFLGIFILIMAETVGLWFVSNHLNLPLERIEPAKWVFHFAVFSFLITVFQVPYNASIIAHEEMSVYAYYSVFEVALKLLIVFLLQWIDIDKLKLYAILQFLVVFFVALLYRGYCVRRFSECRFSFVFDFLLFKKLISYGAWTLFGAIAYVASMNGVNIILNTFLGPTINAARGIAYQVNSAVQSFVSNFQMAVNPQIVKSYASKQKRFMSGLIFASSKLSFFLLFVLALPILMEAEFILSIWLKVVPPHTVLFCRLVLINTLIESLSGPLMMGAQATGQIQKYQATVGSVLLLNLPISYVVLKLGFFPESTALVGIVLACFALFLRLNILRKLIELDIWLFCSKVLWLVFLIVSLSIILPLSIKIQLSSSYLRFILVIAASFLSSIVSIYYFGMDRSERQIIKTKVLKLLKYD